MNMKKILAMMAVATVLTTGVVPGVTAHATFNDNTNGSQTTNVFEDDNSGKMPTDEGEILINGTFNKIVTNLPDPTEDGRYLRVTMPIAMDFVYDVDTDTMQAGIGKIKNESIYVKDIKGVSGTPTIEKQPIKMEFVDLEEKTFGITSDIEFVDKVTQTNNGKIQAPFKLSVMNSAGTTLHDHSLKDIIDNQNNQAISELKIREDETIQLQLGLINGEKLGNKDLIKNSTVTTRHGITLRFEYDGK